MTQPDLHYDGEDDELDWELCRWNWTRQVEYALMRLAAISTKLEFGMESHREDEDRKCIDIMLCIIRDYEQAKAARFLKENL